MMWMCVPTYLPYMLHPAMHLDLVFDLSGSETPVLGAWRHSGGTKQGQGVETCRSYWHAVWPNPVLARMWVSNPWA